MPPPLNSPAVAVATSVPSTTTV